MSRLNHIRRDNDPYSDDEEQEEEEYPSNDCYNVGDGVATITTVSPTIAVARQSCVHREEIVNRKISGSTTKVRRKNDAKIIVMSISLETL